MTERVPAAEQLDSGSATAAAVEQEQHALDAMYARLDAMRSDAVHRREDARHSSDGTPAGRFNRDALQFRYSQEIVALDAAENRLCFGRLDTEDGETRHIGRLGLSDGTSQRRQILLDWRAPASAPFYTATALQPQGVVRRRHLQTRRRRVLSVADEYLQHDPNAPAQPHDDLGAAGNAALLEALNAPRTGRMQDIISTIQAEQDAIIRSARSGVLVVQGGPGTGKTVVALHRAAYLLYTHRERLGGHGVLVIGPNETFLTYIGQVLPSLGESSVVLATVGTMYPGVTATAVDAPAVAEIKGRAMMATVIDNAILDRQRMPRRATSFTVDHGQVRLEPGLLAKAQRRAWGSRLPHNRARQVFLRVVLDGLAKQIAGRPGVRRTEDADTADISAIRKDLAADPAVVTALAGLWPPLTAEQLVGELFSQQRRLAFAAPTLSPHQRDLLHRNESAPFTVSDVPLLDEAAELLGVIGAADRAWSEHQEQELRYAEQALEALQADGQEDSGIGFTTGMLSAQDLVDLHAVGDVGGTTADRAAADREWTYGHVVVDEAQELSAMAWRMVMRRCPVKSMTLVGDVAQTSDPAGASRWATALRPHVGNRWRLEELTVNYRTPAEIMELAAGVLARIDPALTPPTSVRSTDRPPSIVPAGPADLSATVARVVADTAAETADGQLAVLVPDDRRAEMLDAVRGTVPSASAVAGPGHQVAVLGVREAKGLEFDSVVVVEPAEMVAQSARGYGDLYVALTRATQRLAVVHTKALPAGMGNGAAGLDVAPNPSGVGTVPGDSAGRPR